MLLEHWEGTFSCCGHCGKTTSLCIWMQICHPHRPFTISESISEIFEWHITPITLFVTPCLSQYQMDVQYVTQKCVPIADCMSRLTDSKTGIHDPSLSLQIADVTVTDSDSIDWNQIKRGYLKWSHNGKVGLSHWERLDLKQAESYMMMSRAYFLHRFALHIVDGIIFLHDMIVVPMGLRHIFLRKIHDAPILELQNLSYLGEH